MTSPEKAARAATELREQLSGSSWLHQLVDIGVTRQASHFVRVHVARITPEVRAAVPQSVNGVSVWLGAL